MKKFLLFLMLLLVPLLGVQATEEVNTISLTHSPDSLTNDQNAADSLVTSSLEDVEYGTTHEGANNMPGMETTSTVKYIQNETLTGPVTYEATTIKIGSDVTNTKPTGPVVIDGGNVVLKAWTLVIKPNTTITSSTTLLLTEPEVPEYE